MKVLYTSDLHGKRYLYQQLTAVVQGERPDLMLLGGDLCVDCLRRDPLAEQVGFVNTAFASAIAHMRDACPGLPIGVIPGNHDFACATSAIASLAGASGVQVLDRHHVWQVGSLSVTGYACCPPSGWWVWDYERLDRPGDPVPEHPGGAVWDQARGGLQERRPAGHFLGSPTMEEELSDAACPDGDWIFVCHAPPVDSGLDRVRAGLNVGSQAVRSFLERAQPMVALHGHVHESPTMTGRHCCPLGRTLAVNVGQANDWLIYACFDPKSPAESLVVGRGGSA